MYANLKTLQSSYLDPSSEAQKSFDVAVGDIINIIVSFDTGWTKRGNGRSYDSLNGYSTIIGFLSGKVIDYTTRNRKCRTCDAGNNVKHDCRKNFQGSAKAIEADAGVELINHSHVLKEAGLQVRCIIGDEDSSMISAVRQDNPNIKYHKLADTNHLVKNFNNELYKLRNSHKQLNRKGVISHIKKCFSYAVRQNKGQSKTLANELRKIPNHLYGLHENCSSWCKTKSKHTVLLTDNDLFTKLVNFFDKYAANSHKFSISASSQINEAFNNIVAHKAKKNECLSTSAASDFRIADSVCTLNDGEKCIINYKKALELPVGEITSKYVKTSQKKRLSRKERSKLVSNKKRRLKLKQERENLRKKKEISEGLTYASNCNFETEINLTKKTCNSITNSDKIVYFDLESTGFDADADIVQISAKCNRKIFNVYIYPEKEITHGASKVTGFTKINNELYLRDKPIKTLTITEALLSFEQFLYLCTKSKKVVLVAHNVSFDRRLFLHQIRKHGVVQNFQMISGFADTLLMFKKLLNERKGPAKFKLENLATDFLKLEEGIIFHDAICDVIILEKLVNFFNFKNNLFQFSKTFHESCIEIETSCKIKANMIFLNELNGVISIEMQKRLAKHNVTYESLLQLYKNEEDNGIFQFCTKKDENDKVTITANKRVINKLIDHLKTTNL